MFETILNQGGVNYNDQFEYQYKMYCLAKSMPSDAENFYKALMNQAAEVEDSDSEDGDERRRQSINLRPSSAMLEM